jgi:ABC-type multidrug transport system ATPase subunit
MRSSLLSVNKLQKDFLSPMGKKIQLLKEVTFEVQKGEIHAFLGVNGAGKTTTINAILGIGTMTSGQILFD